MLQKNISFLPISTLLLTLTICSHASIEPLGVVQDINVDKQLEQEVLENKEELRKFKEDSEHIEEFKPEEGTFLEEEYVEPEPEITYKYDDDSKFYHEDELPKNKGRLGNVVIKVPDYMSKEEAFSQLESEGIGF